MSKLAVIKIVPAALLVLLTACSATELSVPNNHPGNPLARVGRLLPTTGLRSDFDASGPTASSSATGHDEPHGGHAERSAAREGEQGLSHSHHGHDDAQERANADESSGVRYTCPMHPEIDRGEPGQCPECGMKLVPKKKEKK